MLDALVAAFLLGLLSSLHCGGMCGGISGALTLSLPARIRDRPVLLFAYQLLFNLGRIGSYALAGALVGALAGLLPEQGMAQGLAYARVAVGLLIILLAVQFLGIWQTMAGLERLGLKLWRRLTPLYRPLMPARKPHQALLLGAFWGWLPCGLVYTALAYSLTVPGPGQGALVMTAFGAGTLPMLLLAGSSFALALRKLPATRRVMGMLLIMLGAWTIYAAWPSAASHHHNHDPSATHSAEPGPHHH